ncbi:DUF4838 domain-containing protein [Flavobacterium agrisoli]|nr:DUF4838 domain-containing protein [Flavobacterium agrisoli]
MAQTIVFDKAHAQISYTDSNCLPAVQLLKKHLDPISTAPFEVQTTQKSNGIFLEIIEKKSEDYFEILSNDNQITLKATSGLYLEYAATSLLEQFGIRKLTSTYTFFPEPKTIQFPKNTSKHEQAAFEFRGLLYPGSYDESFRKWHKLNWYLDDFGIWGHSFYKLVPAKEWFKPHPEMFALYNHNRNPESICYSNDTVFAVLKDNLSKIIATKPEAIYFSVSQNDDVIYCECADCQKLNQKYGSPQGAHYYFINKVAHAFPETKIVSLAYLFSYQPPQNLKLAPNLYPMFCPIEANRAKAFNEGRNKPIEKTLDRWTAISKNILFWDYTVEFTNYMAPFPNWQSFESNYTIFQKKGIKGIFSQGYADVPGSFSELKQYLLAKLLWNSQTSVEATTAEFVTLYYGNAAPFVLDYLHLLVKNQMEKNQYLDIYDNPIMQISSFLSPENMSQYDILLSKAEKSVANDLVVKPRIQKLRLDLEYVYFEQAKFYGKEPHGMYEKVNGKFVVKKNLEPRVRHFVEICNKNGIYELSEGGLSPDDYLKQWLEIAQNNVIEHQGEKMDFHFNTQPAPEYNFKKEKGLQDGILGSNNFNFNWTGWYGNTAEIVIKTNKAIFNSIEFNCLEDQRHWIFLPTKIEIWGEHNQKWEKLHEQKSKELTENYEKNIIKFKYNRSDFSKFENIKIILIPELKLPVWRARKNKKHMLMIDEICFN